jgi:hypothetical protein
MEVRAEAAANAEGQSHHGCQYSPSLVPEMLARLNIVRKHIENYLYLDVLSPQYKAKS